MNKKIIAISLLVIVAAISISGCLGPNEDEIYNEKMTEIYNDFKIINETSNDTSTTNTMDNDTITKVITTLDKLNAILDNDTQKLKDLNESIKNDTRKEYITICINELDETKKTTNIAKDMYNTLKEYTSKKATISELQTKFNKLQEDYNQHNQKIDQIDKQRADYEKKYPFVLINGSISAFNNDTWNMNNTN